MAFHLTASLPIFSFSIPLNHELNLCFWEICSFIIFPLNLSKKINSLTIYRGCSKKDAWMHLFQIFSEGLLVRSIINQIKSAFGDFHSADMPLSCKQFTFSDTFFKIGNVNIKVIKNLYFGFVWIRTMNTPVYWMRLFFHEKDAANMSVSNLGKSKPSHTSERLAA